jgi:hypothetical protein
MDQLHEELKQPITASNSEEDEGQEEAEKNHHRQLSRDSDSSSQSEECYESCDSGLSSEKNSADTSRQKNEKQNQSPNCIVSDGKTYIQVNSCDQESGAGDSASKSKHAGRGKDQGEGVKGETEKGSNRSRKYSENPDSKKSQYSSKATLGTKGTVHTYFL